MSGLAQITRQRLRLFPRQSAVRLNSPPAGKGGDKPLPFFRVPHPPVDHFRDHVTDKDRGIGSL